MTAPRKGPLPPTYLLYGLLAIGALHFLLSGPRIVHGVWRLAGVPVAAFGAWLSVYADALFKRLGTEIKPFKPSSSLVTEGPYRFSRHPMYVGFTALLLGLAVVAGTALPLLSVVIAFLLFNARFAIPEERHMQEQFGDEYRDYKSRVRRWL